MMKLLQFDPFKKLSPSDIARIVSLVKTSNPTVAQCIDILGLDPTRDFRNSNLRGVDFGNSDLTLFDFEGADISGAIFSECVGLSIKKLKNCKWDENTKLPTKLRADFVMQDKNLYLEDFAVARQQFHEEERARTKRKFIQSAREALRIELSSWDRKTRQKEISRHYDRHWQLHDRAAHLIFAKMLRNLGNNEYKLESSFDPKKRASRVCIAVQDSPGIFSRFCGAITLCGLDIQEACATSTKDGWATFTFWVNNSGRYSYTSDGLEKLSSDLNKILKGEASPAFKADGVIQGASKSSNLGDLSSISFDNEASEIYTLIRVDAYDRPNLIYDIARTLSEQNIYIARARSKCFRGVAVCDYYVKDFVGLKFHSVSKQKTISQRIKRAVETR